MWKKHIETARSTQAPTKLGKWYGRTEFDSENTGSEGFDAFFQEFDFWLNKISDETKKIYIRTNIWLAETLAFFGDYKAAYAIIEGAAEALKDCFPNEKEQRELAASLGSRVLNFRMDNQGMAIHSQYKSWQSLGGYNNVYDDVFRFFTNDNMDRLKLSFTVDIDFREFIKHPSLNQNIFENTLDIGNTFWHEMLSWVPGGTDTDLILWAWHGDYLNLGAGAELGIYFRPHKLPSAPNGVDHYNVSKLLVLPMKLYLYNYEGENDIENIFAWEPDEDQWWITGFNPNTVGKADVKKQVMIGSVDFSKFTGVDGKNEVYTSFKLNNQDEYESFLYWDDEKTTVWINWYKKELVS